MVEYKEIAKYINSKDSFSACEISKHFHPNEPISKTYIYNLLQRLVTRNLIQTIGKKVFQTGIYKRSSTIYKRLQLIPEDKMPNVEIKSWKITHNRYVIKTKVNEKVATLCEKKKVKLFSFKEKFVEHHKIVFNDRLRATVQKEIIEEKFKHIKVELVLCT